jgi:uncharacterized protein (DUF1501 family)
MASKTFTDPCLSRRRLLQVGSIFGLTLPQLLWARSLQASRPAREKSCIFIVLSGGLSHIDTLDPKPDAPEEIRGAYGAIATRTPGVRLSDRFPLLAQCSDRYCLVRSLSHDDTVHVTAAHTMLTGQPDGRSSNDSPMLGSLVSRLRPSTANMPSHVWLHNMKTGTNKVPRYNSGLSRLGFGHAPFRVGHELDNPCSPDFHMAAFDPPEDVPAQRQDDRFRLLQGVAHLPDSDATATFQVYQQRAQQLVNGPSARQAFELDRESPALRDRYGRHPLGQYTLMARRLIEAGVRMVTVTGWPGLAPGETQPTITQVWDMHGIRYRNGDNMYGNGPFGMKWSLPRLDQALSALIEDLHVRGMLEDTLVVVTGEFGRTPRFENDGKGRGHWSRCYTALLAGGGIRPGSVYGASDRIGAYVAQGRPISHVDFGATLFHALGIPPESRYGPDNFSFRASDGEPVTELFG